MRWKHPLQPRIRKSLRLACVLVWGRLFFTPAARAADTAVLRADTGGAASLALLLALLAIALLGMGLIAFLQRKH